MLATLRDYRVENKSDLSKRKACLKLSHKRPN